MVENDALKMAIPNLEGEANDWWFHGINTLVHDHISSNEDFSKSLVERFDREDPEPPFKGVTQLKQTATPKAYMLEFQKLSVMVSDISMD